MRRVILAAGSGSRQRPIMHTGPKQPVPIANKPALEYTIDDLVEAGIDEVGIILGNKDRDELQEYFVDGNDWGVDITYIVSDTKIRSEGFRTCYRLDQGVEELANKFRTLV